MFTGLEGLTIGPKCITPGCPFRELRNGLCRKCAADRSAPSSLIPATAGLIVREGDRGARDRQTRPAWTWEF